MFLQMPTRLENVSRKNEGMLQLFTYYYSNWSRNGNTVLSVFCEYVLAPVQRNEGSAFINNWSPLYPSPWGHTVFDILADHAFSPLLPNTVFEEILNHKYSYSIFHRHIYLPLAYDH